MKCETSNIIVLIWKSWNSSLNDCGGQGLNVIFVSIRHSVFLLDCRPSWCQQILGLVAAIVWSFITNNTLEKQPKIFEVLSFIFYLLYNIIGCLQSILNAPWAPVRKKIEAQQGLFWPSKSNQRRPKMKFHPQLEQARSVDWGLLERTWCLHTPL
jgi:hypothetical protein